MKKKSLENKNTIDIQPGSGGSLIYADRIIGFAFGPTVSKLTLGMEVDQRVFSPTATLIIPTTALIDAFASFQHATHENKELKDGLIKGLDTISKQYNSL
jgi:hypothetical protein